MYFGKEVRVMLKGQGKEAYLELKKRHDKEAVTILNSFNRIKFLTIIMFIGERYTKIQFT